MRFGRVLTLTGLLTCAAGLPLSPAAGAAEVLAPAGWTGQWDFTITYRNSETGRVMAVDNVSTDICPSEPLGLALFQGAPGCQTTTSATEVSVRCASEVAAGLCQVQGTLSLDLQQTGPTLGGSGEWTASGSCPPLDGSQGQIIEVSAVRRSTVPAGACRGPSSLAQKLVTDPGAVGMADDPFAALALDEVQIEGDEFRVGGIFALAADSNGADPRGEAVRMQVGGFSATIPPGSFRLKPARGRQPAEFTFEGNAGSARLQVRISSLGSGQFSFSAHGEHPRVRRTASPLPFALAVGNDAGTIAVRIGRPSREHGDDDDHDGHGRRGE